MGDDYRRAGKSDLSGMDKESVRQYLQPHYKTDEDLSVGGLVFAFGPVLLALLTVGGAALFLWSVAAFFL